MVRYGMVWYGMVWYGTVRYGMVRYGMVWYGMVSFCMVWYSMVQYSGVSPVKLKLLLCFHGFSDKAATFNSRQDACGNSVEQYLPTRTPMTIPRLLSNPWGEKVYTFGTSW